MATNPVSAGWTQWSQVIRVLNACTDDLEEPAEETSEQGRELIATDEPTVVVKSLLDAIIVEDSQRDGSLGNSAGTDESDRSEVFYNTNDLLDQFVASKEGPRWWWWW
jgi:hypothetical protein